MDSNHVAVTLNSDMAPASSKEFLDIQENYECGFTLKLVRDTIIAYSSSHDSFSILHLNSSSIKKNLDNFKLFFSTLDFSLGVICLSETWLDEVGNSLDELPNYISKHQVRDDRKWGGVSIYIHNSLSFNVLSNLCIDSVDIDSLSIE